MEGKKWSCIYILCDVCVFSNAKWNCISLLFTEKMVILNSPLFIYAILHLKSFRFFFPFNSFWPLHNGEHLLLDCAMCPLLYWELCWKKTGNGRETGRNLVTQDCRVKISFSFSLFLILLGTLPLFDSFSSIFFLPWSLSFFSLH